MQRMRCVPNIPRRTGSHLPHTLRAGYTPGTKRPGPPADIPFGPNYRVFGPKYSEALDNRKQFSTFVHETTAFFPYFAEIAIASSDSETGKFGVIEKMHVVP